MIIYLYLKYTNMKNLILLLFLSFFVCTRAYTQDPCPKTLYICEGYNCLDYFEFTEGYNLTFFSSNSAISSLSISNLEVKDGKLCFFAKIFYIGQGTATFGYSMTGPNGLQCVGKVIFYTDSKINIVSDKACAKNSGGDYVVGCGKYVSTKYFVCKGDTTKILFTPGKNEISQLGNDTMTYDRLTLTKGVITRLSKYDFDIAWNETGEECLQLTPLVNYTCQSENIYSVTVLPKEQLTINRDKSGDLCTNEETLLTVDAPISGSNYIWQLSDGRQLEGSSIKVSFPTSGEYEVTVFENASCLCSSPGKTKITVKEGIVPKLTCEGPVCEGEEITYNVTPECASYTWDVNNHGQIMDGGTYGSNFIKILWASGGTGKVGLTSTNCENICNTTTTLDVPIIAKVGTIEGPTTVCIGDVFKYKIPDAKGSTYFWLIDGKGTLYQDNEVEIDFSSYTDTATMILKVIYKPCFLKCSGEATLKIQIKKPMRLVTNNLILCAGNPKLITTNIGGVVDWSVEFPDGTIRTYQDDTLVLNESAIGIYNVKAVNPFLTTCNLEDGIQLKLASPPNAPKSINGPDLICPDELYKYTIDNIQPNETIKWTVFDGSTSMPSFLTTDNILEYKWKQNENVKLYATIVNKLTGCESEPTIKPFSSSYSLFGLDTVCFGDEVKYITSVFNQKKIQWKINPDSAGYVVNSKDTTAVIKWVRAGNQSVSMNFCNDTKSINVFVIDPDANFDVYYSDVCKGQQGSINVDVSNLYNVEIKNKAGVVISQSKSASVYAGEYFISVYSKTGCKIGKTKKIQINEWIPKEVEIDALGPTAFCMPHAPVEISVVDPELGYTYRWFENGNLMLSSESAIFANNFSSYKVEVTDKNGCKSISNEISLVECCGLLVGPSPFLLNGTMTETYCLQKQFEIHPAFKSTNFFWRISKEKDLIYAASGSNDFKYTFNEAGVYSIECKGDYCQKADAIICGQPLNFDNCEKYDRQVIIPHVAKFSVENGCDNLDRSFIDESSIWPKVKGLKYDWDFDDPASNEFNHSTDVSPTHHFSKGGNYKVTLTLSDETGCVTSFSQTIVIKDPPQFTYSIPDEICLKTEAKFWTLYPNSDYQFDWDFGEPASKIYNSATGKAVTHIYTQTGKKYVTLKVLNSAGCTIAEYKDSLLVSANTLQASIKSNLPFPKCPTSIVQLSIDGNGTKYLWSSGETTNAIKVIDEGTYKVTIENSIGCKMVSNEIKVINNNLPSAIVWGVKNGANYYNSMAVCDGEAFEIHASFFPDVYYSWDKVGGYYESDIPYPYLSYLPTGSSSIKAEIRTFDGCIFNTSPFKITKYPKTIEPIIETNDPILCEETEITFLVKNPSSFSVYKWNNDSTGFKKGNIIHKTSIKGNYFVTMLDVNKCKATSNSIEVHSKPVLDNFASGCFEVCLPDFICGPFDGFNNRYDFYKNDSLIEMDYPYAYKTAGEYYMVVTNKNGCSNKSDVTTISALGLLHQISGIAYIDNNKNNTFDLGIDELKSNVKIYITDNNTRIDSTVTNLDGYYKIDSIPLNNFNLQIDSTSHIKLASDQSNFAFTFLDCEKDSKRDIPLLPCVIDTAYTNVNICEGQAFVFQNISYKETMIDTVRFSSKIGCDSVMIINVNKNPKPNVAYRVNPSCKNLPNGQINIVGQNPKFQYYLNGTKLGTQDSIVRNLSVGLYSLIIENELGCTDSISISVDETAPPIVNVSTKASCLNIDNGSIVIQDTSLLVFNLDGKGISTDTFYNSLSVGNHTLIVTDANTCIDTLAFYIEPAKKPVLTLTTKESCLDTANGAIYLDGDYKYLNFIIDDKIVVIDSMSIMGLNSGSHIIKYIDSLQCEYEETFFIDTYPAIDITAKTMDVCSDTQLGSIAIESPSQNLLYSINDKNNFSTSSERVNLASGNYTIYHKSAEGCIDSLNVSLKNIPIPDIDIKTIAACDSLANGFLKINTTEPKLLFSLDSIVYQAIYQYSDLTAGNYKLYAKSSEGCIYEEPFTISMAVKPDLEISLEPSCEGLSNGVLNIVSETQNVQYSLDNIAYQTTSRMEQLTAGPHILYYKNNEHCIYERPFEIKAINPPNLDFITTNSCASKNTGSIAFPTNNGIQITLNDKPYGNIENIDSLSPGMYKLEMIDSFNCVTKNELEIKSMPELKVDFPLFEQDCYSEAIEIHPTIVSSSRLPDYIWSTGDTSAIIRATKSGNYAVSISDYCDTKSNAWYLDITNISDEVKFFAPNIFKVGAPLPNDCFRPIPSQSVTILSYSISIYDRWGNNVFKSQSADDCWDGTFRNKKVEQGVYVYMIASEVLFCGKKHMLHKTGDVTLIH